MKNVPATEVKKVTNSTTKALLHDNEHNFNANWGQFILTFC